MKVLTVGIIVFIYICSYNIAAAELGDACTVGANDSCTDTGQKCTVNETCACQTDNHYNYDGSKCVRELGRDCSSFDCNDSPVVICDSADTVCKCNPETHYDNNGDKIGEEGGVCVEKHGLNEACTNPTTGAVPSYQCSTTNAVCKDDTGTIPLTYSCQCNDEYVQNGMSCLTDVDDCSSNPCKNDGTCNDGVNDYTCNCVAGYTGKNCTTNINDCSPDLCLNGGTCIDLVDDYTCNCITGYTGKRCGTNINDCSPDLCLNGGTCIDLVDDYTCNCITGYTGKRCGTNIDDCASSPCLNGGTCRDGVNDFTCTCRFGFYTKRCDKAALGVSCSVQGTTCQETNSECGSGTMCVCKNSHYDSDGTNNIGGTCLQKVVLGVICPRPTTAVPKTATCADSVATCELVSGNYRCLCPSTHYDDNGVSVYGGNCERKKKLGDVCPLTGAIGETVTCVDYNARCRSSGGSYKCWCANTHYDSDGTSNIGGTCVSKVGLGAVCPQVDACERSGSECSSSQKCVCQSSYYDTNGANTLGGQCSLKVGLGYSCPMPDACLSSRAVCTGSTVGSVCKCKAEYYDDNTDFTLNGTCQGRRSLGDPCGTSQPFNADQCTDANARCGSNYRCSCNDRYHEEKDVCVADKALGEFCSNANECSDPNAGCLGNKCTCNQQHYQYKPSVGAKDVCEKVEQLQVTGISFSHIQTTQFTVSWTPPAGKESYISGYTIEWRPTGTSGGGDTRNVSSASPQTLTGLTPGRTYEVQVISKNTATQSGSTRSTSSKKDQAAEPSKPGAVTSTLNDLDARDNNITIRWGTSTGEATQYRVKLKDGSMEVTTTFSTGKTAVISHSTLKDGHIYTVHIEAKSQAYDGHYLWSEERISTIKTKVQVPDPPRNGFCRDPTDKSITLEWSKPADTKGDLVKYHIHVYQDSNTVKFIVNTTGTETQKIHVVGNLDPGTSYTFRIYTENEMYNSTSYNNVTTGCKTKAKMSEAPTNLDITKVTSRSFDISWMKPVKTHSAENYGYVLQIKDGQDVCVKEILYRCSDCDGSFQVSNLNGLCNSTVQTIDKTKQELEGQLTYPASLYPDIAYTVTVTAINDAGRGYAANETERTKEEAPQKPDNVMMEDVMAKSVKVTWNIADPRPGKTTYKITLDAQAEADDKVIVVEGFENRSCTFSNLEEFWSYQVTVNASTAIGSNISDVKEIKTLPAAPGNVLSFRPIDAPSDNYRKLKIVWKAPELKERNSIITNYSFRHNTTGVFQTEMFNQETDFTHEYSVMVDVVPEEYYSFEVFAINEQNENGSVSYLNKQAVAGVPKNIENTTQTKIIPKEKVKDVTQTQFTVTFVQEFFEQSENGQIRATGLVACVENKCSTSNIANLSDFNNMDTWQEAAKRTYRVTDESWLEEIKAKSAGPNARRKRDVTNLEYTVGSENCASVNTDEYCNGQLEPNTRYMLFAVACTNGGCLISQPYGPFITLAVPDEDNNLMIIGIVVAVGVVVVIGAVVGFILLRRRKSGPGKMKPVSESDDEDFTTIDPAVAKIQRKRPILLNEIEEYVNKMHKDSNLLFSAEYEDLKTLSPKHACEAADREENRMRNRYINIIPFDHTRVKLSTNGEDDSSDYINANYLPGYSSPREYIGCQGPIPGTIDDFWRMTWEQNVSVVVMLTLCKEGQKIKCEQYWPDEVGEPKQYGDVIVEITSYSNIRTYDYRMFKITNGSTTRVVKHFHFLSWLDFQANVHHDIILDFIEHVRQHVQPPDTSGPMIIHCSAGVGRTGTYIALDHLMQFINEHDFDVSIDIFDLVLKLRENRQHMVQTEQQYVFIHDCVKEIMDRKRRQMENIYENQAFSAQDENIYQNEQSLYENVSQAKSEQNTEL